MISMISIIDNHEESKIQNEHKEEENFRYKRKKKRNRRKNRKIIQKNKEGIALGNQEDNL